MHLLVSAALTCLMGGAVLGHVILIPVFGAKLSDNSQY